MIVPLVTSVVLFALGVYGVLTKKDVIRLFIGVSIMLSGISLLAVTLHTNVSLAYSIVVLLWVVEVMEVIIAIALFIYLARHGAHNVEVLNRFKW